MSRYGLDYYSSSTFPLSYYGSDNPLNYDASPVTALSSGYNQITVTWTTPKGSWASLKIIRSPFGFPVNISDGELIFETTRRADPENYTDSIASTDTKFYYYSIFVYDTVQLTWILAGRTEGLSVKNYGTSDKLYEYLPQIYKLTTPYIATESTENNDLRNFLSLFGFQFDHTRALTELITDRYNFENLTGTTIPLLLNQFGLRYEPEIGYQQARILVRDSVQLTKEKGSSQGLREYIKDFTGWACPAPIDGTPNPSTDGLQIGHNLMLDYNDSSFEESIGHWTSSDSSAYLNQISVKKVSTYSTASNNLRLNIGTHGYKINDKFTMSGFKIPKYNFSSPATIAGTGDGYIEVVITAPDVSTTSAYNDDLQDYPTVTPYPAPYSEPTAPALYPNKQKGYLSIGNSGSSSAAITVSCGSASPITLGVPVTSGDTYTFSAYSAASVTGRSYTVGINWYDRFGVLMSTVTGTPVTNATGSISSRATVTSQAPAAITLNTFSSTAGSGYTNGTYTNVPLTYVSGKQFTIAPKANFTISGGAVQSMTVVNGGKGSDTTTVFSFNKASISSAGGSGFQVSVVRVQESYYAAPIITVSGVANAASYERHYFDACQFEMASSVTEFDEARQVHITMKANRINELKNPTFYNSGGVTPWSITNATTAAVSTENSPIADVYAIEGYQRGGTTVSVTLTKVHSYKIGDTIYIYGLPSGYNGVQTVTNVTDFTFDFTKSGSVTIGFTSVTGGFVQKSGECLAVTSTGGTVKVQSYTNNTQYTPIYYPSTDYTFSIYVKSASANANVEITWYDINKSSISSSTGNALQLSDAINWGRVSLKAIAPATAAYASVALVWTSPPVGNVIYVDDALFENSSFVLPYFDGNTGPGSTAELFWEGSAPNASRSHYYKNRVAIADRLAKGALNDWLMSGSTYALYLAQPQT
jgi:hypothetical protein